MKFSEFNWNFNNLDDVQKQAKDRQIYLFCITYLI
ncbi:hypothetical protein [Mycoplasma phage sp.]|uniref:Uncharacterized protein n=1 Tax=Mycoplasmopsis anatis 1340 TaxID=1034808 RepID=F9QDJ5_9BACT|nr:hypothetical protein GIG_02513 [Mycoplasmopsis anatis 1340]QRI43904.1 hypothetical protein [Mycoplasma phage sp.]QRI43927.1 hypothetical protein [Mycoplasma phage sp.]QRI43962.1 hypothetical protein [Mycoplasma phage sp.]VEU73960.1 Uncharacterised protein [Mycoplasmopsis anatis]